MSLLKRRLSRWAQIVPSKAEQALINRGLSPLFRAQSPSFRSVIERQRRTAHYIPPLLHRHI